MELGPPAPRPTRQPDLISAVSRGAAGSSLERLTDLSRGAPVSATTAEKPKAARIPVAIAEAPRAPQRLVAAHPQAIGSQTAQSRQRAPMAPSAPLGISLRPLAGPPQLRLGRLTAGSTSLPPMERLALTIQ